MSKKLDIQKPKDEEEEAQILAPDFALKKKIGEHINVSALFSPELIAEAQKSINDKQEEFLGWAMKDITALESALADFTEAPAAAFFELDHMRRLSFSLKCQAGTFGFDLASEIARLLHQYLLGHAEFQENNLLVIRKHIESLRAVLAGNVQGDGGATGKALLTSLQELGGKFDE